MMQVPFMRVWTLALLQIIIVGNLQVLPANAQYGFYLPFFYLIAFLTFYLPCLIMTSTLAVNFPQTGGAYIWCEQAYGKRLGFAVSTILWISNLLWYPSIFALIAANIAYLFDASYAQSRYFVLSLSLIFFWLITILNCLGVKLSIRFSVFCSILGIILPLLIIIACGFYWLVSKQPITAPISFFPDLSNFQNFNYLIAVIISLFGIEVAAVHAGDVVHPRKNFPRSLVISTILILCLLIAAECAIAVIVPATTLSVVTGLFDAFVIVFQKLNLNQFLLFMLFVILVGNIGSVMAWMLGSTRGMFIASQRNAVFGLLQIVNRYEAPIGVLILEAVIFTVASMTFLIFPNVVDSFWILLVLASQITLIYYMILFQSAKRLGCSAFWMYLGMLTSIIALMLGFVAPSDLSGNEVTQFHALLFGGLIFAIALPFIFLYFATHGLKK